MPASVVTSTTEPSWKLLLGLATASFLGAWVDWSGFIFNFGAATVLLLVLRPWRLAFKTLTAIGAGTALAGLAILIHYGAVIDLAVTLSTMGGRFSARGPLGGRGIVYNLIALVQGYMLSFGPFLITFAICLLIAYRAQVERSIRNTVWIMAFLAAIPLAQNLLILENSAEFSYERLKFIVPAAIVVAVVLAYVQWAGRIAITAMIVISSIAGVWSYNEDKIYYARWSAMNSANKAFRDIVIALPEYTCAALDLPEYTTAHLLIEGKEPRIIVADEVPPTSSKLPPYVWLFSYGAHRNNKTSQ